MANAESFVEKANKGRCKAFPGYCDKTIATCDLAHPLVNCDRYPSCFNPKCTYLHPVCNYDCKKELCKKNGCKDFHPWRDSYEMKHKKVPNTRGSDINDLAVIPDSSIIAELISKYDKEKDELISSSLLTNGNTNHVSYAAAASNTDAATSSATTTRAPSRTQQSSDNPSIEDEIMKVWKHIVEKNHQDMIRDRKFNRGKCFDCSKAPATIVLLNCNHLIFCKRCFSKARRSPKCLLCGKTFFYEDRLDVLA